MLWLIQRDFLEGQSVQQMVNAALEPVPNPGHDADIDQVRTPLLTTHTLYLLWQTSTAALQAPEGHTAVPAGQQDQALAEGYSEEQYCVWLEATSPGAHPPL